MNKLGDYIKGLRVEKKLSIRKASERIGISHTYLDSLEKGFDPRTNKERTPTFETMRKISVGLGADYEYMLYLTGVIDEETYNQRDEFKSLANNDEFKQSVREFKDRLTSNFIDNFIILLSLVGYKLSELNTGDFELSPNDGNKIIITKKELWILVEDIMSDNKHKVESFYNEHNDSSPHKAGN